MSANNKKVKAKAVEALRSLLNAAKELTDAEKILRESPPEERTAIREKKTILAGGHRR